MITGKTKTVGILGWPVGHSMSPLMHNAAFADLGLDYSYIPLPVHPDNLAQAVAGLKSLSFVGANVTIPHKVTIIPFLDEIHPSAKLAGAVNTLVIREGKITGYNTDCQGFILSLKTKNITIQDKTALIMGAGGAARAVVSGLLAAGIKKITIGTRSLQKAEDFIKNFSEPNKLQGCNWNEDIFKNELQQCDLLINCTPIGMDNNNSITLPVDWQGVAKTAVICDLIYNPTLTQFLADAQNHGHIIINGAGMLIEQGALAFELWTGVNAPRNVMRNIICQ